jgi:type IV pilus assembly protein PilM
MAKNPLHIPQFLHGKDKLIGLDIGSSSIKLAELVHEKGKLVLSRLKLQEIDSCENNQDKRLDALKSLLQDVNTKDAKINVVVNCSLSCMKICVIPFIPKSEILQALKWEIKKFISFPIDQAAIDYKILQETAENEIKKIKIAVALCPQETVDKHITLLRQAGVESNIFTQHGFALKNLITNLSPQENKTIAIMDIGHNFSVLSIFQDRELTFNRQLPVAGMDFSLDLTQSLVSNHGKTELTIEEAEDIKKKYGIVSCDDSKILEGKITGVQLNALIRPNLEKLLTEIERSFTYYREKEQGTPVERLILLGGGSNLKNLTEHLSKSLCIPVQLGEPLESFPLSETFLPNDEPEATNRFASALGAALASPHDINLLPVEIKQQTRLLIKRSTIKALITTVIVILILVYTGIRIKLGNYEKSIAAAELELGALSSQIEEIPNKVFLQGILNERVYWSDALKGISNLVPEQVRLTEMSTQDNILTLKGQIQSPGLAKERVLTEFMHLLEKEIFEEVSLISTKDLSQNKLSTFELRSQIE